MTLSSSFFTTPLAVVALVLSASAAHATITVDFTGQTGFAPTRTFSSGGVNLSFAPSSSSAMTNVASSANGLCLFAYSSDNTARCGVTGSVGAPSIYNFIEFTSNAPLFFTGGNVKQILGTVNATDVKFDINGSSLAVIPGSTGDFTFASPVTIQAGQTVVLSGSGNHNSSIRVQSFNFEEVPGPLPLLGAGAAFAWSRRLRNKTMVS